MAKAKETIEVAGVRFSADEVETVRVLRGGFSVDVERIPAPESSAFGFQGRVYNPEEDDGEEAETEI